MTASATLAYSAPSAVLARMESLAVLSPDERGLVERSLEGSELHRAGSKFLAEGAALEQPRFVISGWGCRACTLPDGRRQIIEYYLPGEIMGYSSRHAAKALGTYTALTRMETADAREIALLLKKEPEHVPGLRLALERSEKLEEYHLITQIVRIGRQTAYERLAHLVLEFRGRLRRAGLAAGNTFPMPLTQEALGDGLGLSIVHMNRTVQHLRRDGLLTLGGASVTLLEPDRLEQIADFKEPLSDFRALEIAA